jgi:hypothetical protein
MIQSIKSFFFSLIPLGSHRQNNEYDATMRVMQLASPYFLAKYLSGCDRDVVNRNIKGVSHTVERYNHGLAHGLRQGALAKDIFDILAHLELQRGNFEIDGLLDWVQKKKGEGDSFLAKLEMAACFQRSGRQMEGSSSAIPNLYKKYELQDGVNFQKAAVTSKIFQDNFEIDLFKERPLHNPL